jgi:hypothetical protein
MRQTATGYDHLPIPAGVRAPGSESSNDLISCCASNCHLVNREVSNSPTLDSERKKMGNYDENKILITMIKLQCYRKSFVHLE